MLNLGKYHRSTQPPRNTASFHMSILTDNAKTDKQFRLPLKATSSRKVKQSYMSLYAIQMKHTINYPRKKKNKYF